MSRRRWGLPPFFAWLSWMFAMVRYPKEAAARILNDCFSIVAYRCMEHAEWTVANVPAQLSIELIEDSEGQT
jgi:hypothetical protein